MDSECGHALMPHSKSAGCLWAGSGEFSASFRCNAYRLLMQSACNLDAAPWVPDFHSSNHGSNGQHERISQACVGGDQCLCIPVADACPGAVRWRHGWRPFQARCAHHRLRHARTSCAARPDCRATRRQAHGVASRPETDQRPGKFVAAVRDRSACFGRRSGSSGQPEKRPHARRFPKPGHGPYSPSCRCHEKPLGRIGANRGCDTGVVQHSE